MDLKKNTLSAALVAAGVALSGAQSANAETKEASVSSLVALDETGRVMVEGDIFDDALAMEVHGDAEFEMMFESFELAAAEINLICPDINNVAGCGG